MNYIHPVGPVGPVGPVINLLICGVNVGYLLNNILIIAMNQSGNTL